MTNKCECLCGKDTCCSEENGTSACGVNLWCLQLEELTPLLPVMILPIGTGLRSHTSRFNKCRTYA